MRRLSSSLFQAHRAAAKEERAHYIVKSGLAFQKSKKLHAIEGLRLDGSGIERRKDLWAPALYREYARKWGVSNCQLRASSLDYIASTEEFEWRVDSSLIFRALDTIRNPSVKDSNGICVLIVQIFAYGNPDAAETLAKIPRSLLLTKPEPCFHCPPSSSLLMQLSPARFTI